ncbi:hypothetical protein [Xenorhabdus ishibashii]|uniref:hypothetical protein n=1 Tax=Xenorhabdus ishibashii TaxID=1034471 RepID=UPI00114571A5|nr:hypothetical protein [Xenorhabdus ishibashii]
MHVLRALGENDFLVEMAVSSHARKLDASLPERWTARLLLYRHQHRQVRIISSVYCVHSPKRKRIQPKLFWMFILSDGKSKTATAK